MTTTASFNLVHEPWVRVRLHDGRVTEWSLRDTLTRAAEVRALAGEIPTQDAAVLRLLLTLLLSACRPRYPRSDSDALDLWEEWWRAGAFPEAELDRYLDAQHQRFDLLDEKAPFMQVAGLTTASGRRSGLGKLIADLPDGHPYFTTRAGRQTEWLNLAEAARWVVHCQAFDPSGIKSGAEGDLRVKGGKGYPFGYAAWTGNVGLVVLEGANLFETLMLNLPLRESGPDDLPVWERAPLLPGVESPAPGALVDAEGLRMPAGPADLFTWPSRRLRLFVEDDRAIDVQISNGDKRAPQNLRAFEPMSAWRRSANQSKRGTDVFMPATHDPSRHVWQGLGSLLQSRDDGDLSKRAETLNFVDTLVANDQLSSQYRVDLHIVGLSYGPQNATIAGGVDDRLTASVAALVDPVLVEAAVAAAHTAQEGVVALANLAGDLDRAAGGDGHARGRTFELGYALLDGHYRAWIRRLVDPHQVASYREAWAASARNALVGAADSVVANAGPAALVGRKVTMPGGEARLLDAGVALGRFHHKLASVFPFPSQDR